jgi:hypothetical protein
VNQIWGMISKSLAVMGTLSLLAAVASCRVCAEGAYGKSIFVTWGEHPFAEWPTAWRGWSAICVRGKRGSRGMLHDKEKVWGEALEGVNRPFTPALCR